MKIRRLFSLLIVFVFGLAIAVSCTPSPPTSNSSSTTPATTAPVFMGFSAWPGWFPWQIAQEEKIFEANKVKVDLKWFDGYLDSINALAAGQLDANTQTLNDTINSIAAGAAQVIVLVNDNSTGNDKIIVRDGINTIADLKGKRIGVEVGTVDHFLLLLGLKKAGLSFKDVQIQPLETRTAATVFVAEQVDAVGVFAPFTTKALERPGSKELFSSQDFPGAIPDHLVVTKKMIEERPQDVQALVNTWFDTLKFMKKNSEKSLQILAKRAGVTVEEYKKYDTGTKILTIQDNLKAFSPGKDMTSLSYAAQEISKFLVQLKLIKQAPDLSNLFDDRFVKAYVQN